MDSSSQFLSPEWRLLIFFCPTNSAKQKVSSSAVRDEEDEQQILTFRSRSWTGFKIPAWKTAELTADYKNCQKQMTVSLQPQLWDSFLFLNI